MSIQIDEKQFDDIFEEFKNMVFRTANLMLHDVKEAEDISQEVFIRIYRSWNTYDSRKGTLKTWICRITVNECISSQKRKRNRNYQSLDQLLDEGYMSVDKNANPEKQAILKNFTRQLLNSLNSKYRAILVLRFFNDMSYEQIAEALEIPLGTVKTRISNAINMIRNSQSGDSEVKS